MQHTPYGYEIVNGKAVIDGEKAEKIHRICENYLSGMSFVNAAADVGLSMSHCGVKRMIQNPRYLGDDFYPAILTGDIAERIEEERLRRSKALGRNQRKEKDDPVGIVHKRFTVSRVELKYENPVK